MEWGWVLLLFRGCSLRAPKSVDKATGTMEIYWESRTKEIINWFGIVLSSGIKKKISSVFGAIQIGIFPTPLYELDATNGRLFKWSLSGLNSEFSFTLTDYHTKVKELSLSYYLSKAGTAYKFFISRWNFRSYCRTLDWIVSMTYWIRKSYL